MVASVSAVVVASVASTLAGTESVADVWVGSDIGIQMFNEESQTKSV